MTIELLNHEARAQADVCSPWAAFQPPKRISVAESAASNLFFKNPGDVPKYWSAAETPYMIEPMNMLASRRHEATVLVKPARTGGTAGMLLGLLAHAVCSDPGDMLFIQMTQEKARDFSRADVNRAIQNSPNIKALLSSSKHADNMHDKLFMHGMQLKIAWPTASNVSGSTYRYVAITDIDRMANAENVDGEGPLFDLALKRTTTFMSRGMCLVESSPGREITDPNFIPLGAHEGPNVSGVVGLYNNGDRRRWYWKCPLCAEWFEPKPGLDLFGLPSDDVMLEIVRDANIEQIALEHNRIICPHCSGQIGPKSKFDLNTRGRWLREGQMLTAKDELIGEGRESTVASFWMGGIPAAYQSWRSIILRHLSALRHYAVTGEEEKLKTTVNVDQGRPYMSRMLLEAMRSAVDPAQRKEQDLVRYVAPEQTRFLAASVDIQAGLSPRFVVQVHAIGVNLEQWPIDRFSITESLRPDPDQEGKFLPLDPARYAEDWDTITERVLRATYRTTIPGIEMRVRMVAVDSGGEDGVTERAYAWYRRVRAQGFASRVMLIKGQGRKATSTAPLLKESWVGNRNPQEKGDIPLYLLNTNLLKDSVDAGLKRPIPGPGYIHIPGWYTQAHLDEFQSEIRNADGTWTQVRKRNESFDLTAYIRACCLRLGADRINWMQPPPWAKPAPDNDHCLQAEDRREMQDNERMEGAPMPSGMPPPAPPRVPRPQRRVSRSSYVHG